MDANGQPVKQQIPSFSNWAPRVSATYDLFGNGKTSVHASYSLYYQTKITLANSLGGLATQTTLTWGNNTVQRRLQHGCRRVMLDRRQPRRARASERAHRHADHQQQPVRPRHRQS